MRWNGQANSPVQRRMTPWIGLPSASTPWTSRVSGVCSGQGQWVGNSNGAAPTGRSSSTTPTICGITSPARWMITVSPTRMSLRAISSALCSVAFSTTTPPTVTGVSRATGVTAPVRPTCRSMASRIVRACCAGNLRAIAQRGERETKPSRCCQSSRSTL